MRKLIFFALLGAFTSVLVFLSVVRSHEELVTITRLDDIIPTGAYAAVNGKTFQECPTSFSKLLGRTSQQYYCYPAEEVRTFSRELVVEWMEQERRLQFHSQEKRTQDKYGLKSITLLH